MSFQSGPPGEAPPSYSPLPGLQQPQPGQYPPQGHSPIPQFASPTSGHYPAQGQYPSQGHSPIPQFAFAAPNQYPAQGQYPQQGHSLVPQDRAFGSPPPGQYPPQGFSQPGFPSPQGTFGQYQGIPPQHQYAQGLPSQYQYAQGPPQQQFSQSYQPQQQFTQGFQPQQQQYGAQPQSSYYGGPPPFPTPPTPGYGPDLVSMSPDELERTSNILLKAMKRAGTDEVVIIRTLAHFPATSIQALKTTYQKSHNRSLEADIKKETSGHFRLALLSILRGPLHQDVYLANKALEGAGTNEELLDDVLLARSNADLLAIKQHYYSFSQSINKSKAKTLEAAVSADLSAKTDRLYSMVLSATRQEESAPVIPQYIDAQVIELHRSTEAKFGTDQLSVCSILSSHSDGQIRAIAHAYEAKYRIPLETVIKKEFSGHMKHALLQMLRAATDRALRDAVLLEDTMAGFGTRDDMLVFKVVALHWNREHMGQVKGAYKAKYDKELAVRIRGETSGDYQRLLLEMVA